MMEHHPRWNVMDDKLVLQAQQRSSPLMTVTACPRMKTALEAESSSITRSPPRGEHCSVFEGQQAHFSFQCLELIQVDFCRLAEGSLFRMDTCKIDMQISKRQFHGHACIYSKRHAYLLGHFNSPEAQLTWRAGMRSRPRRGAQ